MEPFIEKHIESLPPKVRTIHRQVTLYVGKQETLDKYHALVAIQGYSLSQAFSVFVDKEMERFQKERELQREREQVLALLSTLTTDVAIRRLSREDAA